MSGAITGHRCKVGKGGLLTRCLRPGVHRSYGVTCDMHHAEFTAWVTEKHRPDA